MDTIKKGKRTKNRVTIPLAIWGVVMTTLVIYLLFFHSGDTPLEPNPVIYFHEEDTILENINFSAPRTPAIQLSSWESYNCEDQHINITITNTGSKELRLGNMSFSLSLNPCVIPYVEKAVLVLSSPPYSSYPITLYTPSLGRSVLQGYGEKKILSPGETLNFTLFLIRNTSINSNEGIFGNNYVVICNRTLYSFNIITRHSPLGDLEFSWVGEKKNHTDEPIFYCGRHIDSWGGVREEASIYNNLSITNTAGHPVRFRISLYDPFSGYPLFPSDLSSSHLSVFYIQYMDKYGSYPQPLYSQLTGKDTYIESSIPPYATLEIPLYIHLSECEYHTFQKGLLYECYLSVYELPNGPVRNIYFWVQA